MLSALFGVVSITTGSAMPGLIATSGQALPSIIDFAGHACTRAFRLMTHHADDVGGEPPLPGAVHEHLLQQQNDADGQRIALLGGAPLQAPDDDGLRPRGARLPQGFRIRWVPLHVGEAAAWGQQLGLFVWEALQVPHNKASNLMCGRQEGASLETIHGDLNRWQGKWRLLAQAPIKVLVFRSEIQFSSWRSRPFGNG